MILKQIEVNNNLKKKDEQAIINAVSKKDYTKIKNITENIFEYEIEANFENNELSIIYNKYNIVDDKIKKIYENESSYGNNRQNNKNFEIKIYDNNINTQIIDKIQVSENISNDYGDDIPIPYDVNRLVKKGIRVINNIYQSKYNKLQTNGTGLGDFIRGSYFLLQFCDKYNFEPRIVFNNCINKFLRVKISNLDKIQNILININSFKNNNFKSYNIVDEFILQPKLNIKNIMSDFIDYIMDSYVYNNNVFIYCISYPIDDISEKNKEYMRMILEPNEEIKNIVKQTLQQVDLTFKQYSVFHIRSGDEYLNEDNKKFYNNYLYKLKNEIQNFIFNCKNKSNKYLIISDNNEIKILLNNYFPYIKIILKEITHFGEGNILDEEKVKNTLIDFYLLSFSNSIISLSSYKHGSGFSYWCAKTYDIPYTSKYIDSS